MKIWVHAKQREQISFHATHVTLISYYHVCLYTTCRKNSLRSSSLSRSTPCSEVYPFFVIVLGLENILIIVKAVMSTPEEFEVKQRIAAGLSKEGWAISRNLSTLLLMLCMGIVFFNYTMKVRSSTPLRTPLK